MADPENLSSSLDSVAARVENDLRLIKRDLGQMLGPVEQALATFRRSLEDEAALKYASSHNMARPTTLTISPEVAGRNLLLAVERLVQLRGLRPQRGVESISESAPKVGNDDEQDRASRASIEQEVEPEAKPLASALPKIAALCDSKKLVIVGALAGRKRPLPEPLEMAVEWIDTAEGGTHATGNVTTRIRQGRVFGVIICDQAISHKTSEPLVAAARGASVPIGFAGKGGGGAIARALKAIEEQL